MPGRRSLERLLVVAVGSGLAAVTWAGRPEPVMPAFDASLAGFEGTWMTPYEFEDEERPLRLVIRNDAGRLAVRYELPTEDKLHPSDWRGQIEFKTRLNVRERHTITYQVEPGSGRISFSERIEQKGGRNAQELLIVGHYALENGQILRHCASVLLNDEPLPCPPVPMVYTRVSDETRWVDR